MDITFITGNKGKVAQVNRILNTPIKHKSLDLSEIQSLDLKEIVTHKAKEAFRILQSPVLVEDVGLVFTALNKLPGPLIKWFLKELENEGLCRLLDGYPTREASGEVVYGLCDGETVHLFSGVAKGTIAMGPRGDRGFGWNPVFIPEGHTRTLAEMSDEEQDNLPMRKPALRKLEDFLASKK